MPTLKGQNVTEEPSSGSTFMEAIATPSVVVVGPTVWKVSKSSLSQQTSEKVFALEITRLEK